MKPRDLALIVVTICLLVGVGVLLGWMTAAPPQFVPSTLQAPPGTTGLADGTADALRNWRQP